MDLYELSDGAVVSDADGRDLGRIGRFVVDPSRSQVSHVVIESGGLFAENRLLPIGMLDRADSERAVLSQDVVPEDLPIFEREHYVDVDDINGRDLDPRMERAALWRFPTVEGSLFGFPEYPTEDAVSEGAPANVPDGDVVVTSGTPVRSRSGEDLGTVVEVEVDRMGGVHHLVVDLGFLEDDRVLPTHWIDGFGDDQITVAVGRRAMEGLPHATNS